MLILFGLAGILQYYYKPSKEESKKWVDRFIKNLGLIIAGAGVIWLLGNYWMPLGAGESLFLNIIFVGFLVGLILIIFNALEYFYPSILRWCLNHKTQFLAIPSFLILVGLMIWLGFNTLFGFVAKGFDNFNVNIRTTGVWSSLTHTFPGVGEEFMPTLDEGSFLLMPTSMPHSGMEYNRKVLAQLDML